MQLVPLIVGVLILILIVLIWRRSNAPPATTPVQVESRQWNIIEKYDNHLEAAELLARVHQKMVKIMKFLGEKYHVNETDDEIGECDDHAAVTSTKLHKYINALLSNYNPDVFYENAPGVDGTAYTLNKGDRMMICLRSIKDPSKLVDEDTLTFVMLHEMSHIANYDGWGHDDKFWEVFKFILHEAVESGHYKPINYSHGPINYCGLDIGHNPYYDPSIKDIWK